MLFLLEKLPQKNRLSILQIQKLKNKNGVQKNSKFSRKIIEMCVEVDLVWVVVCVCGYVSKFVSKMIFITKIFEL